MFTVSDDRRAKVREVVIDITTGISDGSVHQILIEELSMKKLSAAFAHTATKIGPFYYFTRLFHTFSPRSKGFFAPIYSRR